MKAESRAGDQERDFLGPLRASMRGMSSTVHVDEAEGQITQNLIHKALERVTSIPEAKRHVKKFEHPKGGDDGSLLDILRRNMHLIATFLKVQFGKHCRTVDPRGEIRNIGERIVIRNSNSIQSLIIATRSPTAIFLLNYVKRRSPR